MPSEICQCGKAIKHGVLKDEAGWYIGSYCQGCGPIARESEFYDDIAMAKWAFITGHYACLN